MAAQDGVAFPRWDSEKLGWRATGMHTGDVDGRPATTVYYEKDGRTLAYTIVAGDALDGPEASRSLTVAGTTVELFDAGAGRAATWERDGHTCVLTGRGVPDAKLAELAGWQRSGAAGLTRGRRPRLRRGGRRGAHGHAPRPPRAPTGAC